MKELAIQELDDRLQKQLLQAREALQKGGYDYAMQVCGELLKKLPEAWEVRELLWQANQNYHASQAEGKNWFQERSGGLQFKMTTRSLLKKNPLGLISRCDDELKKKQSFAEIFYRLREAGEALGWIETKIFACKAVIDIEPDKIGPRLDLATALLEAERPQQAIEHLEWVLAKEPSNGNAQTLLNNASVAETLQRGNWEDTDTTFHAKKRS